VTEAHLHAFVFYDSKSLDVHTLMVFPHTLCKLVLFSDYVHWTLCTLTATYFLLTCEFGIYAIFCGLDWASVKYQLILGVSALVLIFRATSGIDHPLPYPLYY
jgi:hypothetical protein